MVQITHTFYPKTRAQWRKWLSKYHDQKKEIWVVFYKKHTAKPTLVYEDAVNEALCFGWIDGIEKRIDEERYALRFTPRSKTSNWSKTNIARYHILVKQKLMTQEGVAAFNRKFPADRQVLSKV